MEAPSCVAAVVDIGKHCISTLKTLYRLHEKHRSARATIVAIHSEITVIGALMQFINVIFEHHHDFTRSRFVEHPELEQIFTAALAGCSLVLSCLDEDIEKFAADLNSEDFKGEKGELQTLWREDIVTDLLNALRGQHAAIFSIIQCLHVYVLPSQ